MKLLKTVLFASAILAGGMLAAGAQTVSPSAGVSAATHCKDAQGNVKLKTASSTEMPGTSSKSGSTTGSGSTSSGMNSGAAGTTSGSAAVVATLPPCSK
jgi:hypothetical protein